MATITRREFLTYRLFLSKPVEPEKTDAEKEINMLSAFGEMSPKDADMIMRTSH